MRQDPTTTTGVPGLSTRTVLPPVDRRRCDEAKCAVFSFGVRTGRGRTPSSVATSSPDHIVEPRVATPARRGCRLAVTRPVGAVPGDGGVISPPPFVGG